MPNKAVMEGKFRVVDEVRQFKGDPNAKWVRVSYFSPEHVSYVVGVAVDNYESREEAVKSAKMSVSEKYEKELAEGNKGVRWYQNSRYSDLINFRPDASAIGDLVMVRHRADFISNTDMESRHKIASLYYKTSDGKFQLKISESRTNGEKPEFHVMAWENRTEEESRQSMNSGGGNSSVLETASGMYDAYGFDELNEKIAKAVKRIEATQKINKNRDAAVKKEKKSKVYTEGEVDKMKVNALVHQALEQYNAASVEEKKKLKKQIEDNLASHKKGIDSIGYGSEKNLVEAGKIFLQKIENSDTNKKEKPMSNKLTKALNKAKGAVTKNKSGRKKEPRTKAGIAADKNIKAKHPGKRTSADGNTYFESRPNRSDNNRSKKFDEGGKPLGSTGLFAEGGKPLGSTGLFGKGGKNNSFYQQVADLMKKKYNLQPNDFDWDMEKAKKVEQDGESANEYVLAYGEKHDLTDVNQFADGGKPLGSTGLFKKGGTTYGDTIYSFAVKNDGVVSDVDVVANNKDVAISMIEKDMDVKSAAITFRGMKPVGGQYQAGVYNPRDLAGLNFKDGGKPLGSTGLFEMGGKPLGSTGLFAEGGKVLSKEMQIEFTKKFIDMWELVIDKDSDLSTDLTALWNKFCNENKLPQQSAEEVLTELLAGKSSGGKDKKVTVYKFEDLDSAAQARAISNHQSMNVDYEWWDSIYEGAETIGVKITSFDLDRNKEAKGKFEEDTYDVALKIKAEYGETTDLYKLAMAYIEKYEAAVELHSDKIDKDVVAEGKEHYFDSYMSDADDNFKKDVFEEFASMLQTEYEYLTGDESIKESIIANDYEFLEDGRDVNFAAGGKPLGSSGLFAKGGVPEKYDDPIAAHEIELYAENNQDLYRQRWIPILKNLKKKKDKGVFDVSKAAILMKYYVEDADKRYDKEHGSGNGKGFMLSVNDRKKLAYDLAVEVSKMSDADMTFARGGTVEETDLLNAADTVGVEHMNEVIEDSKGFGYEEYYSSESQEVDHQSVSGFVPYTDGGHHRVWFEYENSLTSMGKRLPTNTLQKQLEKDEAANYQQAKDWFKETYPEIVDEVGEDNIDYNTLYEKGYGSEAEELSEHEQDTDGQDSIMFEVGYYFYNKNNWRGASEGKSDSPSCRVYALVNMEGPYHRSGNLEQYTEEVFEFKNLAQFTAKFKKAMEKMKVWMEGGSFDEGTELTIRRMAKGGTADDQNNTIADPEVVEMKRGGATVARIANQEANAHSEHKLPFKGNNLEGKLLDNGDYVVLSYGYYPIWYWSSTENKWYGNATKYSATTSKQLTQSRPAWDAIMLEHEVLLDKMRSEDARFDLGGVMIKALYPIGDQPMPTDNVMLAHGSGYEGIANPIQ